MTVRSIDGALERARSAAEPFRLRLFVAGSSPISRRAIANLQGICDRFLGGRHELEVIDIYQQIEKAQEADIVGAPTLIKSLPLPVRRLVGDLSDERRVIAALGLAVGGG